MVFVCVGFVMLLVGVDVFVVLMFNVFIVFGCDVWCSVCV